MFVILQQAGVQSGGGVCSQLSELQVGLLVRSLPRDGVVVQISQDVPVIPRYVLTVSGWNAAEPDTGNRYLIP